MDEKCCVVQFLHPGSEPDVRQPGDWPWNIGNQHRRKFLVSPGEFRAVSEGASERSHRLGFWGEWEAPSVASQATRAEDGAPRWLHEPCYTPLPPDQPAQNTDPFVFGEQFHFTGCQQHVRGRPTQLARLKPGSVILFGSGRRNPARFLLDTVFVVGDRAMDHDASNQQRVLAGAISPCYRDVTIDRWYAGRGPSSTSYRLYFGATPEKRVAGMFSFFPCFPLGDSREGFARPRIELPGYVTPSQTQKFKKSTVTESVAVDVWQDIVEQVRRAGCLLGTRADLPPRAGVAGPLGNSDALPCGPSGVEWRAEGAVSSDEEAGRSSRVRWKDGCSGGRFGT